MGVWLRDTTKILHKYLDRSTHRPARQLSSEETATVLELRQLEKNINVCVTEIILIKHLINHLKIRDLFWVVNNFERIATSLIKQRRLVSAARLGMMALAPDEDEAKAIARLKPDIEERIRYLNSIPIPENILLTPIHEYVELSGEKSFADIIRKKYPTAKEMVQLHENIQEIDAVVNEIVTKLKEVGKENDYVERLNNYIAISERKKASLKAEKERERRKEELKESQNGIFMFTNQFFEGIRTLKGNKDIGLSLASISRHMAEGHRGKFCVLCCGLVNGRLIYRYVKDDGSLLQRFTDVGIYDSYDIANTAISRFKERWPTRAFEAVAI